MPPSQSQFRVTFVYSDTIELKSTNKDFIYEAHLNFPSAALLIPNCREAILEIAALVGELTQSVLHIKCKELELKNYPVKITRTDRAMPLSVSTRNTLLMFECWGCGRGRIIPRQRLRILAPIPELARFFHLLGSAVLINGDSNRYKDTPAQVFYDKISKLANSCLILMNAGRPMNETSPFRWSFVGFNPYWQDAAVIRKSNNAGKRLRAEARKREREEKKLQGKIAKTVEQSNSIPSVSPPKTGAGRRPGAIPGVFKGIQFRSQLEIRFAAQLEEKQIRWFYEPERLTASNYLVDFYLPDLKCWVEVKGRFESRDNFLLKEVAAFLKKERDERLFVFAQTKAYKVSSRSFHEITHSQFWLSILE